MSLDSQIHLEPKFDVANSLRNFSDHFGFKRPVALQLAWAIVLARHQGQDTVIFAFSANIDGGATQSLANYFSITVKLINDTTIFKALQTLQKESISLEENTSTISLFDTVKQAGNRQTSTSFAIQSILQVMDHDIDIPTDNLFDIDIPLVVRLSALDELHVTIQYGAGISGLVAESLGDHFLSALKGILASDVDTTIDDIDLLSAEETASLLELARPSNPPSTELLHVLFEKQALSSPDAVAIENEDGDSMTYYELNAAADHVSKALSCGPGSIVPVCIERSNLLVVALLAVLKTGAAYVIIDPEYPKERQKLIADDVKALFVLVSGGFRPRLPYRMIDVEKVLEIPSGDWDVDVRVEIDEKHAAYVIYTSGSTGTPKGVILEHGAVTSGIMSAPQQKGLRSLLFYNPVFSAAQRTVWTTLAQGGCLCIASKNSLTLSLSATVSRMNVNQLGITPSTARLLSPESVPSLKRLTLTGERVSADVIRLWADKLDLKTGYGLSEVTQLVWTASLGYDSTPNDIGRPEDTTSAYILVPGTLKLSPVLVAGELCLAGPQLARSYLNRPDETARKFIKNPFGPGRLYRTGDLAICRESGNIEILGRIDRQVKIAGQRVEPEEVAAVIRNSSVVEDAVVVPITLESETVLVACIVLKDSVGDAALEMVRGEARRVLPSFAIPFCVPMSTLPVNHNGKTDLVALQNHLTSLGRQGMLRLSQVDTNSFGNNHTDWTADQQAMRRIWSTALSLDVETVQQNDSFLALGGSSLRAIQVSMACRDEGIDVSAAEIIRANSLASLVETMLQNGGAKNRTAAVRAPIIDMSRLDNNIKAEEYTDILPVSPLQEAVVATTLSGASEYTYQRVFKIQDDINLSRLKAAFESVARAQSILHTTFLPYGSSFVQAVLPDSLPWSERDEPLDGYLASDLKRGFMAKEPFCRVAIFPTQGLLVFTTHHALFDFWSNNFVFDDVAKVYHGHTPSPRPSYRSFIEHLSSSPIEDSHKFWEEYLDGASTSRIGIVGGPKHVSETTLNIDINQFLTSHSMTSGALIYAAWALIVSAHTSSSDVTFGTTLSGRDVPIKDVHLMNGPTLTTVPQRIRIDFTQNAIQYVSTVQERLWAMNEHSQFGMRNALRASNQTPSLFDTLVNLLVTKQAVEETLSVFQPYGPSPAWETEYITLEAIPNESTFRFRLISHLEARRSDFIVESLVSVIKSLVTDPYARLFNIGLVGRTETDYLKSLSPPILPQRPGSFLHLSFEDFASSTPHSTAIQWENSESISYDQLNSRANRLAVILREKGIGPGVKVPLCLERSVIMVVCILAVLKAGGAYVPLDHENPPERNMFIVGDVEAILVLTTAEHSDVFADTRADVLCVEDLDLRGSWPNVPVPGLTPDCLAYIIYTSGSTGTPKGVLIQHSAVSVAMQSLIKAQGCDATWRALQFTNYVFDVSVSDIFATLGAGGTVCMASTANLLSDLAQCINMMGVTHMFLTPTVAKLIWPKDVPNVKVLFVGGESLAQDVVSRWAAEVDMRQGYGPTEASVFSTFGAVPPEANGKIIGKPLESLSALILEANSLRLAPYGAIGELCLSGPQLAQGYLKRQEATNAAFVDREGTQIYRTGDLARWLPDGQIECFGRKDHQVKIAGHRIELGEIEQAILTSGSNLVHNCVVGVLDVQGKPQLVAFVVFSGQSPHENLILPSGSRLDEIVSVVIGLSTLPPYMVPKTWIPMSQIPLLPSGKADRKRLVRLAQNLDPLELSRYSSGGGSTASTTYVAPETDEEKLHQSIWSEIMNVSKEAIGATSSFFAFGGDSITAINLVSKFRKAGYSLAVGDILAFPVLRDMAARMKPIRSTSSLEMPAARTLSPSDLQDLRAAGVREEDIEIVLPAGPGQTEFLNMGRHDNQYWRMQATRPLPKDFDVDRWLELTHRLTTTNSILRTLYVKDEHHPGAWLQVILKKPVVDFEIVAVADETEKDKFIEDEWGTLFKLNRPPVRYRLIKLPDGHHFLTIKLDHGSYDGTLLRLFDSQFIAMSRDQPFEKPVPFQNYVSHIHHTDKTPALHFWQELLKNSTFTFPSTLSETPYATGTMVRKVDSRIDAFAAQTSVTASIVFQAAYTLLLSHLSGSIDISYDNLVTGRDIDALDGQLINGECANFVPFRSSYDPDGTTVRKFLTETQATFWETMGHGTLSLTEMHRTLQDIGGRNKCLFLFQPFEPASGPVNHMRWMVIALSKTRQPVNYAIMMEVFKNAAGMGYTVRFKYDERVFGEREMEEAGDWLVGVLENMMQRSSSLLVDIV